MKKVVLLIAMLIFFTTPAYANSEKEIKLDVRVESVVGKIQILSEAIVDRNEILIPISVIDQLNQESGSIQMLYAAHPFEDSITILAGKQKSKIMLFINKEKAIWIDNKQVAYYREVSAAPRLINNDLYIPLEVLEMLDLDFQYEVGKNFVKPKSRVFTIKSMDLSTWKMVVENSGVIYEVDFSGRALGAYGDINQNALRYAKTLEGQSVTTEVMPNLENKESLEINLLLAIKEKMQEEAREKY